MFDFKFYVTSNIDESKINQLITGQERIMTSIADLDNKTEQLLTGIANEQVQVQGMLQDLRDQITELQNNGGVATQEQLDAFGAKLDEAITKVDGISEALPTPTEPTEPNPENPV